MNNLPSRCLLLILACVPVTLGQGGKVAIRLLPKPNQVCQFQIIQEMDMDVTYEGSPDASGKPTGTPAKMTSKSTFVFTQKNGAYDEQGKLEALVTYDRITLESSMNGRTLPADSSADKLIGKPITVVFDKDGNAADIKVPPEVEIPADAFKDLMGSMYTSLPSASLAVGETATLPFNMPLPIPLGTQPLSMSGKAKYKLVSFEKQAGGQLAKFDQTVEASLVQVIDVDTPGGRRKVDVDFKLSGGGTLQLDLDRGIVKDDQILTTIDGGMTMQGDLQNAKLTKIKLHGTGATSIKSSFQPV